MTGEALTTQRSAMPEILVQIGGRHLNGGNPVRIQQVEELPARHAEQGRRLALGKTALLEPAQNGCLPPFLRKLVRPDSEDLHGLLRKFNGYLPRHGGNLIWFSPRSNE